MKPRTDSCVWAALLALLAACASAPKERFYTLTDAAAIAALPSQDYAVVVGPVFVPEAVDRPQFVLRLARSNLRRWAAADGRHVRPSFREWHSVLHRLNAREIADFLCSNTPMARRLRQSSPFAGILSRRELQSIRRQHETAGA